MRRGLYQTWLTFFLTCCCHERLEWQWKLVVVAKPVNCRCFVTGNTLSLSIYANKTFKELKRIHKKCLFLGKIYSVKDKTYAGENGMRCITWGKNSNTQNLHRYKSWKKKKTIWLCKSSYVKASLFQKVSCRLKFCVLDILSDLLNLL